MEKEEANKKPVMSETPKNLPLESKGLKSLNEKFIQENTEKIKKEEESKKCQ